MNTDPLYEFNLANKFGPYRCGPAFEFDLDRSHEEALMCEAMYASGDNLGRDMINQAHDEAIYMDSMMCFCVNSECPACTAPME